MNYRRISLFACAWLMLFLTSCKKGVQPLDNVLKGELSVKVNPYDKSPLTAEVSLISDKKGTTSYTVLGSIPVSHNFSTSAYNHNIPIVGLYPDTENKVSIEYKVSETEIYVDTLIITTDPLPEFIPDIEVVKADRSRMEDGFHLVEQLIANNGKFLTFTLMYDDNGDIRWMMDMSSFGQITYTSYRLKNGNWLYLSWIDMYEVNDLGKVVSKEQMWNYAGDHDLMELENGNILMGGSKKDAFIVRPQGRFNSRFDFVVEWDRRQNKGVKEWDLRKVLDVDRTVYPADYSLDFNSDWYHINSVDVDEKDGSLLISGRNQGVLKVDANNNLKYILAPHKGWNRAGFDGNGMDLKPYLLTAVDAQGNAYPSSVQQGTSGVDDFEWPTGQHSATFLDNGNILLFDNGLM
ncbi:MAG: aryl-sulfate sulfotransferase, partial [Saprospiraceae bacterium]|nr:aryl-sulfate sulfotransferase [Saprospiraceae bacterium]